LSDAPIIRIDLEKTLSSGRPVVLELGCGQAPHPGRIGIDHLDMASVEIVADLEKGLPFFPDSSVDEIHARSFFEHLENFEGVMREIVRVLKPGGTCTLFVPHFSNPYYYSDYTHRRFFGLYTLYYFVEKPKQLRRKVPDFYTDIRIEIVSIRLKFSTPFRGRQIFKKIWGAIFNSSRWMQEYYEENLCWKIPCYGLKVVFRPQK
jgi:ubiquinone/menaquinone biosynthesis C-methylase UbiE